MRSRTQSILTALAVVCAALVPRAAHAESAVPAKHRSAIAGWTEKLARVTRELDAGDWEKAKSGSAEVLDQMKKKLERADGAGALVARSSLLQAIAEQGLGEARAAAWNFAAAFAMDPKLVESFETSPKTAPVLAALREGWKQEEELARKARDTTIHQDGLEAPRSIGVLRNVMPFSRLEVCVDEQISVHYLVGTDGLVRHPTSQFDGDPLLSFIAIDSVRRWAYQPARLQGQPVVIELGGSTRLQLNTCDP